MAVDIADQDIFRALRAFLLSFLPANTEVIQGLDNAVAMPLGGFVVMTSLGNDRLSTVINNYPTTASPTTKSVLAPSKYSVQLDFYGPNSQSWSTQTQALFHDFYAADMMPANIQPLFADNPIQMPLVDAEMQYEQRWKLTAVMQYNPTITVSQQYAAAVNIGLKEVDTTYPPN